MGQNRSKNVLLARKLKQARLSVGIRQVDVADALKRPQSFVAKVESGERGLSFLETLEFCAAVGLDPIDLVRHFTK